MGNTSLGANLRLNGKQFEQLSRGLKSAFHSFDSLKQLVLFDLDVRLPANIKDRWDEFLAQQKKVETQRQANGPAAGLVRLLRALRTSSIGFADDGTDRVHQLERTLRRGSIKLEESEWRLLQRLSTVADATAADLSELAACRGSSAAGV